ncbi:hypothetical protein MNBD_ALPHA06-1245 [hydrothermal vent metagenome]|uniref:Transporter n=1 Tax=hydrothermal vent metagenome TaxID=652676 RepID=A0A3B0RIN1_9ZZZZ
MRKLVLISATCLAFALPNMALADDTEFRWSSGLDYTSGKYTDSQKTEILYLPFTGQVLFGNFTAKATVPYIRIKGPGTIVGGGEVGPITRDQPASAITTEDGLGDVVASLTYTVISPDNTMFLDFTGKVKLPTASSDKNLGTGETDFTALADLTKTAGPVTLFATAGYRFMGSSPALPLRDGFLGSIGLSTKLSPTTSIGLIYDYREAASRRSDNPSEITGFIGWKLTERVRLQTYGVIGLSNGSPDTGIGLQISFRS